MPSDYIALTALITALDHLSCYRRLPFLSARRNPDRFLSILEQTRQRYRFVVVGYVIMPESIYPAYHRTGGRNLFGRK